MQNFNELNLHDPIHRALKACGYETPTPVQAQAIPPILAGKDVVVTAQTGTGKTAAFVLPSLNRLSEQPPAKKPRILILTPTRELATQVMKATHLYGKFLRFNIISLVGGMPYPPQVKDLARGADVIVATPGRLLDHIEQRRVDLSQIEILILDEADRMLDMGFIEDVEYIAKLTPKQRQTLLFSATMDKQLLTIVSHLLKQPVRIDLSEKTASQPHIKQIMYRTATPAAKTRLLKQLLSEEAVYKAIIFTATKIYADKIADELADEGFAAAAIHGDLRQNVRNRQLEQFRRGKTQFLVATDVAARGIDVSDITHVFNYDLPRFSEDYVHRIGRTGRAGKTGIAISFVSPSDMKHLQRIERYTNQKMKLLSTDRDDDASSAGSGSRGQAAARRPHHEQAVGRRESEVTRGDRTRRREEPRKLSRKEGEDSRIAYVTRDEKKRDRSERVFRREENDSRRPFRGKKAAHEDKTAPSPFARKKKPFNKFKKEEAAPAASRSRRTSARQDSHKKKGDGPARGNNTGFQPFKRKSR